MLGQYSATRNGARLGVGGIAHLCCSRKRGYTTSRKAKWSAAESHTVLYAPTIVDSVVRCRWSTQGHTFCVGGPDLAPVPDPQHGAPPITA